jgi:hypothetical protein
MRTAESEEKLVVDKTDTQARKSERTPDRKHLNENK